MNPSQATTNNNTATLTPVNKSREDRIKELKALLAKEDIKIDTPVVEIPEDVKLIIEALQGEVVTKTVPLVKEFRAWHPKNSTDVVVSAGGRFDSVKLATIGGYTITYKIGFNISKAK